MTIVRRSATWFALAVAACALSAFAQLNPTVKVLPKPQTAVPPECAEGLVAATPRVIPQPQPVEPQRAPAPPSLDLKTRLRAVQVAAEANDRDAFKAALADARSAVSSYPAGGERNAANDVIGVYSDLERLWDYAFNSPSGAFFDNSTDFVSMTRRYPDYAKFISDKTLSAGGQTVYPTRETRQFLTTEASRRLSRLGVRTPARVPEEVFTPQPPKAQPQPQPKKVVTAPKVTKKTTTPSHRKPATKIARATPAPARPRVVAGAPPARKPARAPATTQKPGVTPAPAPVRPRPTPAPVPRRTPTPTPLQTVQPKPVPVPVPAPVPAPLPAPVPQPVPPPVPKPIVTPSPAPMPAPTPTTTTASATTETTATAEPATTTTNNPAAQPVTGGRMNLLLAIILIIVGIGVLIVLFRASD